MVSTAGERRPVPRPVPCRPVVPFCVSNSAGLALLRGTRPSEVERFRHQLDVGSPVQQWMLWNVLGVFGALLLYIGLHLRDTQWIGLLLK
eukprot:s3014_g1.t1